MHAGTATGSTPGTAPEVHFAAAWADFTKAFSIYPEANERVQARLQGVLETLADQLGSRRGRPGHDAERGLTVLFRGNAVLAGDTEQELDANGPIGWLRQRVAHAGLAGVEFMPGLRGEVFVRFTKRLLRNFLDKSHDPAFESLWPEAFDGLVLVDRRFEGTFGGLDTGGRFTGGHAAGASSGGAGSSHFVTSLLAHPKVSRRVMQLEGMVAAMDLGPDEETIRTTDLIKRILDDVPAEALKGRDSLIDAVCKVMDGLAERSASTGSGTAGAPAEPDSRKFAELLHQVSRTHFARKGPGLERLKPDAEEPVEQSPAGGRSRDQVIEDDVEALVAELAALPATPTYDLARGDAENPAEQLAVLMHYLVKLEQPRDLHGLYPALRQVLAAAGPAALDLIRGHVETDERNPELRARRRRGIVGFLQAAGQARLLRTSGVLTAESVTEDIPGNFPLYLASLDTESATELHDLDELCATLGTAILDHEAAMRGALASLPRDQAAALLARPQRARLSLARLLVVAHPGRLVPETTLFLRAVRLLEDEAFLLFQLHDHAHLTEAYLASLIDLHFGRVEAVTVRRHVVEILCRHIRGSRTPLATHPERLASIRSLARFPSANGWVLLQQLQKTKFGPFGGPEPRVVRKLARTVARELNERRAGGAAAEAPAHASARDPHQPDGRPDKGHAEAA